MTVSWKDKEEKIVYNRKQKQSFGKKSDSIALGGIIFYSNK